MAILELIQYLWIRRNKSVKIAIFLKAIFTFSEIPINKPLKKKKKKKKKEKKKIVFNDESFWVVTIILIKNNNAE